MREGDREKLYEIQVVGAHVPRSASAVSLVCSLYRVALYFLCQTGAVGAEFHSFSVRYKFDPFN